MTQSRSRIVVRTILRVADDTVRLVALALWSHAQLAAENLSDRRLRSFALPNETPLREVSH